MALPRFNIVSAIAWATIVAGVLDIAAVLGFWALRDVGPVTIFQSIASSLLGRAAFDGGAGAALLGVFLHFAVSFVFAAFYVLVSLRLPVLRRRPLIFGVLYGAAAQVIMSRVVVPLTLAEFGQRWPPPPLDFAASTFIHLFLFGLPIALVASRLRTAA